MEFKDTSLETKSSLRYGEPMIDEKKYKKFDFSSEYKKAEVYFNSDSFYSASYASSLPQIPFSSRKSLVLIRYFSIIFTGL